MKDSTEEEEEEYEAHGATDFRRKDPSAADFRMPAQAPALKLRMEQTLPSPRRV